MKYMEDFFVLLTHRKENYMKTKKRKSTISARDIVGIIIAVIAILTSVFLTISILNSDLPLWVKYYLLK